MMLVLWGALIVGAVILFRWLGGSPRRPTPPEESSLDTLKRRYAAGELTEDEYEKMRAVVEH